LLNIAQLQQKYIAKNRSSRILRKSFLQKKKFLILIFLEDIVERALYFRTKTLKKKNNITSLLKLY